HYLTLATNVETFLATLHQRTNTATIEDRQRVLRLLVKDVLIGPDNVTIRHRIPTHHHAGPSGSHEPASDTEGDHPAGYPLCWGRNHTALRHALRGGCEPHPCLDHPGLEPAGDHSSAREHPQRREEVVMVDGVEGVP